MDLDFGSEAVVGERNRTLPCIEDPMQVRKAVPGRLHIGDALERLHLVGELRDDSEVAVSRPTERPEQV